MRKILSLLMMVLFAGFVMAGSYTISFKDCGKSSDSSSGMTSTTVSDYVAAGAEYVSEVAPSGKVYLAAEGAGLKFGNSSNGGSLTLTLATAIKPTSIVVNASQFGASEGTGLFQGQSFDLTGGGGKYIFNDYTVEYDGNTEVSTISVGMQKRGYVTSITVNYASEGGEGGEGGEEATVNYYIVGTMTDWQVSEDYKLTANPGNEAEYLFTELALTTASQFKVVAVAGEDKTWYPDGQDNNYGQNGEILADGSYDVYFRPDGQGGEDWFYNVMYVAAHQEPQIPSTTFVVTVPEGTDSVFVAGSWDNWAAFHKMAAVEGQELQYTLTIEATSEGLEYKYLSGPMWAYVEVRDNNRTYSDADVVETWNDVPDGQMLRKFAKGTTSFIGYTWGDDVVKNTAIYNADKTMMLFSGGNPLVVSSKGLQIGNGSRVSAFVFRVGEPSDIQVDVERYQSDATLKLYYMGESTAVLTNDNLTEEGTLLSTVTVDEENTTASLKARNVAAGYYKVVSTLRFFASALTVVDPEPLPTVAVAGSMNEWSGEANVMTAAEDGLTATATIALEVGNYDFKMVVGGHWLGKDATYDITRENPNAAGIDQDIAYGPNLVLHADTEGDYTFVWTYADNSLAVTYPEYVEPVTPKYYLIGDSAFVVAAGATADKAWTPDAIPSNNDTTVLNLKAGQDYIMRLSLEGTWENHRDFRHLTDTAAGLIELPDEYGNHSIGFQLAEAGEVKVVYIAATEEQPEVFKLIGNFYVAPAPDPTVAVMGSMNDWTAEIPFVLSDDKTYASLTVEHISADKYEFKFLINGAYRSNGYTYHRDYTGAANITGNDDNMKFIADQEGEYTFYWYFANDSAAIVYPEYIEPAKEYYAKYAPAWEWVKLTEAEGLWLTDTIVYKGTGININDKAADEDNLFYSNEEIETARAIAGAEFAMNDTIVFSFNPADSVLTAIMIAEYVAPAEPDPTVVVYGSMTQPAWEVAIPFELAQDKQSAMLYNDNIKAGEYTFKVKVNGEWRSNGATFNRENATAANITGNDDANMTFVADQEGEYTFVWFFENDSLAITYPEYIEPATPKFYVTGNDALVGEELEWNPAAIPSMNDTLELDLQAGVNYLLKVTLNGTWQGENNVKGYNELTEKPEQLSDVSNDHNIGFQLAEAGKVQVVYIAATEEQPEVFKLMGNFYQSETPVEHTYTVAGNSIAAFEMAWSPKLVANDMVLQEDGTYKWEKAGIELLAGHVEFKVCEDHGWDVCYPASNYVLNIAEVGTYTITITFNPAAVDAEKVAAEAVKTGDAEVDPTAAVKGGWDNWAEEIAFQLAEDKLSASGTLNLEAGEYEFKMILNGGDWRSNGYTYHREYNTCVGITGNTEANMVLQADVAGQYVITWTFANDSINIAFPELPVEFTCNWDEIAWLGGSNDQIKVCKESDAVSVVNVQNPHWSEATEDGIYMTFPSAAWGEISLPEGKYETQGAGMLVFLSALTQEYNEISIVCQNVEYIINVYNAANAPQPAQPEYFLVGTMNNWQAAEAYKFSKDETCAEGEFILHADLAEGDEIKVIGVLEEETIWYPAVGDNYIVDAAHAGEAKAIYFRPEYHADWAAFGGHIWIGENQALLDAPDAAPSALTYAGYQVHAAYSATYNADCNFGEWESGTQYTQEEFGKKYVTTNLGYFGLEFTGMDCSEMEALHLDVWTAADASIRIVPIHGGTEVGVTAQLQGQQWNAIDIPMTEFAGVTNWSNVYQIKIDNASNLTFWLNNIYFYTTQEKTVDLADGYYLIGNMNGWDIHNLTADHLFAVNPDNEAEYMLHYTLAEGNEFKVVAVANNELGAWYPGEAGNYVVDFAHAGEKDIYFRPDYQGGEGWHAGCIYVEGDANANPWETWFAIGDTWNTETESYMEWDGESQKATIHINVDKYGQWRAQVKYHGPVAEEGKCYHVALKLKANNAISNVTIKYQDNVEMVYVNDAALAANVEFVFDTIVAGLPNGNGIMVLDFGFAHAGDIIEIYDVVIEETECPATRLEDGYYLIGLGMADWTVDYITADYLLTANPSNEGEYMLNITLAKDQQFKVVSVANDAIVTWYPDGMDNNYIVDANHAGATTVYFRPDGQGGEGWHYGMIYVAPTSTVDLDNIDANAPAVKIIRNGQILIIKGQKMYNVMGQTIQ